MTPEERAERLAIDHGVTMACGYKHEDPAGAARLIAAAIREAVAAERERCARIAEADDGMARHGKARYGNMDYGPNVARRISAAIRTGEG